MNWQLMTDNAITQKERNDLAAFICNTSKITQGTVVKEFENAWSSWLGCKYSVFVNSGSSANLKQTNVYIPSMYLVNCGFPYNTIRKSAIV